LTTGLQGSPGLKPEKSSQFSLGIVFSPTPEISGSVDFWSVDISNAILQKSEIQVLSNATQYKDFIYRYDPAAFPDGYDNSTGAGVVKGSTNTAFPIAYIYLPYDNTGKYFAAGLDFNLQLKTKVAMAAVGVNYDSTLYTKHGYKYSGGSTVSDIGDYKDFGPTPKYRHSLTFAATIGAFNASLTNNFTSGYWDYTNPDAVNGTTYPERRKVSSYSTWNTQVAWKAMKNLDLVLGIKNVLDQDPPSSRTEVNFQTGYDAQFTNPLGRTGYVRLKYKFL
jgi:iron complex outermembrane receptor protein